MVNVRDSAGGRRLLLRELPAPQAQDAEALAAGLPPRLGDEPVAGVDGPVPAVLGGERGADGRVAAPFVIVTTSVLPSQSAMK